MTQPVWLPTDLVHAFHDMQLKPFDGPPAFGIARNHPVVNGNKRAALFAIVVFPDLNGIDFEVDEAEAAVVILALAASEITGDNPGRCISDHLTAV